MIAMAESGKLFADRVIAAVHGDKTAENAMFSMIEKKSFGITSEHELFRRFGYLKNVHNLSETNSRDTKWILCQEIGSLNWVYKQRQIARFHDIYLSEGIEIDIRDNILDIFRYIINHCSSREQVYDTIGEFML